MASFKKNYFYQIIYEVLAICLPLITAPYIARVLGDVNLGVFSYTHSIANIFLTIARLGIINHGSRSIALYQKDKEERSKIFWEIYSVQAVSTILLTIAYLVYIALFVTENQFIAYLQVVLVVSALFDIGWLYMGMENFKKTVTKNIFVKLLSLVCIFAFVRSRNDLWIYTLVSTGSMLLGYATLWLGFSKEFKWVCPKLCGIKKQIKPILVLFIPAIAVILYTIMDKVMLGGICGTTEVGYYEQAAKLVAVPLGFITSFGAVMLPRMSAMEKEGGAEKASQNITTNSLIFMVCLSSAITFGLSAISETLIPIYYGSEFLACIPLLVMISMKLPVMAWANVVRTQCLIPKHRDKEYIISLFVGAGVNVVFNMILIPKLAAVGAAIGTILAETAVCLVQTVFARDILQTKKALLKSVGFVFIGAIMLAFVKMVMAVMPTSPIITLVIGIGCGVIVYTLLAFAYYCAVVERKKPDVVIKKLLSSLKKKKA